MSDWYDKQKKVHNIGEVLKAPGLTKDAEVIKEVYEKLSSNKGNLVLVVRNRLETIIHRENFGLAGFGGHGISGHSPNPADDCGVYMGLEAGIINGVRFNELTLSEEGLEWKRLFAEKPECDIQPKEYFLIIGCQKHVCVDTYHRSGWKVEPGSITIPVEGLAGKYNQVMESLPSHYGLDDSKPHALKVICGEDEMKDFFLSESLSSVVRDKYSKNPEFVREWFPGEYKKANDNAESYLPFRFR
jgi:hypothetical protein